VRTSNRTLGLEVEECCRDGIQTLALGGELDIASATALQAAIARLCSDERTRGLILDLSKLEFIDSMGLAAIVYAGRLCERWGHDFELIPGGGAVQRVFELTGLTEHLPFRVDGAAAVSR
jgi:anti-sigma B factor antagonist